MTVVSTGALYSIVNLTKLTEGLLPSQQHASVKQTVQRHNVTRVSSVPFSTMLLNEDLGHSPPF